MKSIGNNEAITKHQEEEDTQPEAINKASSIIIAMSQGVEAMTIKGVVQERKQVQVTIQMCNVLCGSKDHKLATCRKLARAKELLRKDKQRYWNEKRNKGRNNVSRNVKRHQINEEDEASLVSNEDFHHEEEEINTDYKGIEEINFPYSEFTEEEDLAYYNDD